MFRQFVAAAAALAVIAQPALAQEEVPFHLVTSWTVANLDPARQGFWMPEYGVAEMLMQFRDDGQFHPWLLESIENRDPLSWHLRLNPGITFQNGKPVDAAAVVASIERQLEYSTGARGIIPEGTSFVTTGELEITVETPQPLPSLPGILSNESYFMIYDAEAVDAVGEDFAALAGAGIYTGPYEVIALDEAQLELTRYDGYWQGVPALTKVTVSFVADANARLLAVQNGEADAALSVPIAMKPVVDATPGIHFNSAPATGAVMGYMNVSVPPLDDPAVRRALILSVDYDEIANTVLSGLVVQAEGFYDTRFPWALRNQATDIEAATDLLEDAGWAMGDDGYRHREGERLALHVLIYPQIPDLVPVSTALQDQLRRNGFEVTVRTVDDITSALLSGDVEWNVGLLANSTTSWGLPEPILNRFFASTGDRNFGGLQHAEIDELAARLAVEMDEEERTAILHRVQEIMVQEDPLAFSLYYTRGHAIANDRFRDFVPGFALYHISWQTAPAEQ